MTDDDLIDLAGLEHPSVIGLIATELLAARARIAELEREAQEDHDWDEFRTYTDTGVRAARTCSRCGISQPVVCKDDREAQS